MFSETSGENRAPGNLSLKERFIFHREIMAIIHVSAKHFAEPTDLFIMSFNLTPYLNSLKHRTLSTSHHSFICIKFSKSYDEHLAEELRGYVNDFKYSGFEFCRCQAYGRCRAIRRK